MQNLSWLSLLFPFRRLENQGQEVAQGPGTKEGSWGWSQADTPEAASPLLLPGWCRTQEEPPQGQVGGSAQILPAARVVGGAGDLELLIGRELGGVGRARRASPRTRTQVALSPCHLPPLFSATVSCSLRPFSRQG